MCVLTDASLSLAPSTRRQRGMFASLSAYSRTAHTMHAASSRLETSDFVRRTIHTQIRVVTTTLRPPPHNVHDHVHNLRATVSRAVRSPLPRHREHVHDRDTQCGISPSSAPRRAGRPRRGELPFNFPPDTQLKYHLGLWFTKVAADITAVAVESACGRGRRATACNAMCANRNIPSAIYGSLGRADMERLTIKKQRTPPRGKGKAKRGEPSAESAEEWQPLFVNGVCMACHELRMAALYSAYAAGATSMSEADAYADALMSPWPEKATMAPDPISAPTSATQAPPRPQTCACDLCENSPARYARQSDSGIEDQ